jgi:hypothetical protein
MRGARLLPFQHHGFGCKVNTFGRALRRLANKFVQHYLELLDFFQFIFAFGSKIESIAKKLLAHTSFRKLRGDKFDKSLLHHPIIVC